MKKRTIILTAATITGLLLIGCAASAAQVKRLDMETAKNSALKAAGFSSEEVSFHSVELDRRNGIEYYDVEFTADGKEYDYDIDALTGTVIGTETPETVKEKTKKPAETPAVDVKTQTETAEIKSDTNKKSSNNQISESEAKKIALAQVPGAAESNIREWEVDYDDGRLEYEGSIHYNEMEYEFEIDGYSGAIRSWEVESIYD